MQTHRTNPSSARRMQRCGPTAQSPTAGFTLVELMIAVAVVAILLAVALPSFLDSIRKGRRADAFAAIAAAQQAQERWRSNHAGYTAALGDLVGVAAPASYTIDVSSPPSPLALASAYVVTAEARAGTSQASDGDCRKLSVLVNGGTIKYAACASCSSFTYETSNACWTR